MSNPVFNLVPITDSPVDVNLYMADGITLSASWPNTTDPLVIYMYTL